MQPPQNKQRTMLVTVAILMTELCERLTFYSLTGNLVLFCTNILQFSNDAAVNISFSFTALVYFIPLGGGYIADLIAGRFNAIYGSALIYVLGAASVTLSSGDYGEMFHNREHNLSIDGRRTVYLIGLLLIAIGSGGIKSNVSPFGAQQLEQMGPRAVQSFFNWFYWFINLGAAVAYSAVVYVQQEVNFFTGYLIPTFSILLAIVIFSLPKNNYIHEKTGANAIKDFVQVYAAAISKFRRRTIRYPRLLDYARLSNGGDFPDNVVDNVLRIQRILPIFACIIMFWTIYFQMQNTFFLQGERMSLNLTSFPDRHNVRLPVASLNLFNTVAILLVTPLLDRVIYPLLWRTCSYTPSKLQRIGVGMVFAASAVIAAGILEVCRKEDIRNTGGWQQEIAGELRTSSYISIFVQVPQFLLIGVGEVFTSVTSLEFAFSEAPKEMKSVIMGVCLVTSGLGSLLGLVLVLVVNAITHPGWIAGEINSGHLDNFCFLLGGLMLLNFLVFIPIARMYKYASSDEQPHSEISVKYYREVEECSFQKSSENLMQS